MPARETKPKLSVKQASKAAAWALDQLGIGDWQITLSLDPHRPTGTESAPDNVLGLSGWDSTRKEADIWINLPYHAVQTGASDRDPISTLFHEILHVAFQDAGINARANGKDSAKEHLLNRMGDVLATAYRKRAKR